MFRRAVFALMLIGAAFVGGAAINGPGLAWLQRNFAGGPSIIVDSVGSGRPYAVVDPPPKQLPTAKTLPLQVDLPPTAIASPSKKKVGTPADLALNETPLLPEAPSNPASSLIPLPDAIAASEEFPIPPLPLDTSKPAAPAPASLPRLDPSPLSPPKSDPIARLASVSVERPEPSTPAEASSPSSTSTSATWSDLRKRMKALGIVRYTIEGDPNGRARFRCVIPVDGLKAVGHHFEAEGDDELQAVEAALKRITLWKATATD